MATNNTGGLLVFDLPDLPVQRGGDVRVYNNKVVGNKRPNQRTGDMAEAMAKSAP